MDYRQLKIDPEAHIAPNATILGNVELGRDVTVFAGATLRGDYGACIKVGDGTNIQEGVCVHLGATSPTAIGRGCTVGHGAIVHGCTIGDRTLIGMGTIILDGAKIGTDCRMSSSGINTRLSLRQRAAAVPYTNVNTNEKNNATNIRNTERSA